MQMEVEGLTFDDPVTFGDAEPEPVCAIDDNPVGDGGILQGEELKEDQA